MLTTESIMKLRQELEGKEITIIGTVYKLNSKTSSRPTTLKIENC